MEDNWEWKRPAQDHQLEFKSWVLAANNSRQSAHSSVVNDSQSTWSEKHRILDIIKNRCSVCADETGCPDLSAFLCSLPFAARSCGIVHHFHLYSFDSSFSLSSQFTSKSNMPAPAMSQLENVSAIVRLSTFTFWVAATKIISARRIHAQRLDAYRSSLLRVQDNTSHA